MNEFIDTLKINDKVFIVYGENAVPFEGYVNSITDNHLVIHEYVSNIYRTLNREAIVEISKV